MLRVTGRLNQADLTEDEKHPVTLPKHHHVSTLIARECHEESGHSGVEYVISQLRKRYWLIGGRGVFKGIRRECVVCNKLAGRGETQRMADLPEDRVTAGKPPFHYAGVIVSDPFWLRDAVAQRRDMGVFLPVWPLEQCT